MWRTARTCAEPGCGLANVRGTRFCEKHQAENYETRKAHDRNKNEPWRAWYGWAIWERTKTHFRATYPERALLCQHIENGVQCKEFASEIDHIIPHRGNRDLFLGGVNYSNLQGLCHAHHSQKTAKEVGWAGGHVGA
ncbi:MAG TPA: HNH endonuclease signature motif containing protein [Candidatus Acidoferrales bacterium]|nr:HNH endonuclease signature motif containing protein [Candidatus Acidoferrales bacterium]